MPLSSTKHSPNWGAPSLQAVVTGGRNLCAHSESPPFLLQDIQPQVRDQALLLLDAVLDDEERASVAHRCARQLEQLALLLQTMPSERVDGIAYVRQRLSELCDSAVPHVTT